MRARHKLAEQSMAILIDIANKSDVERKIAQGNSEGEVTTPKGVDCPTKSKNSDGIAGDCVIQWFVRNHGCYFVVISKMDRNIDQMTKPMAMGVYHCCEERLAVRMISRFDSGITVI
jgi:hypothetical protein